MQKLRTPFAGFVLLSASLFCSQASAQETYYEGQGYYVDQPGAEETYYEGQGYYVDQPGAEETSEEGQGYYVEQQNTEEAYYQIPAQGAYYDEQGNYIEQVPAQGAYYDEQVPAQGAYYDEQGNYVEQMPVQGAYYGEQGNYVEQMPAQGAYYDEQGNYVEQMPAQGAYYDEQGNYVEQMPVQGAYYNEQAPVDQNSETAEVEVEHALPTSGFNIRASLAAPITGSLGTAFFLGENHRFSGPGFGFSIQAIYRTGRLGYGIEQKLHGIYAEMSLDDENDGSNSNLNQENAKKTEWLFMGATLLLLKEYVRTGQYGLFTFGQGFGLAYGSNTPGKKIFATTSDSGLAFKLELGYSYFILGKYGIGFNLEYLAGVYASKSYPNIGVSYTHAFVPMLTYEMIF